MSILNEKIFKITILSILLAEFLSFFGYFYPIVNKAAFFAIVVIALAVSLYKLEYGLLIMLAELIIGSKGYLFYFDANGFSVSIRIALFIVVMAVWASRSVLDASKASKTLRLPALLNSSFFPYFLILFLFIVWGVINGILQGNSFNNLFFDFNGWLYFLLVFPVYDVICGARDNASPKETLYAYFTKGTFALIAAALIWLCLKTFFLLFIFSHASPETFFEIYRWVRTSGVGEITNIQGGFYRIFFQSHIFTLIGFFVFFFLFIKEISKNSSKITKNIFLLFCFFVLLFSCILISFSRSFWLGLISGLISIFSYSICQKTKVNFFPQVILFFILYISISIDLFVLLFSYIFLSFSRTSYMVFIFNLILVVIYLIWQKQRFKKILQIGAFLTLSGVASIGLIALTVKFPYPKPVGVFETNFLSERASELNESAISSRWELLPNLWEEIKTAPILGKGFGATVSYKSSDPRVLEANPSGEYTTYAFEWGWLDIWIKTGIFGLLSYAILMTKIIISGLKEKNDFIRASLAASLVVLALVNVFSPYLNHPLGIGYLIFLAVILEDSCRL